MRYQLLEVPWVYALLVSGLNQAAAEPGFPVIKRVPEISNFPRSKVHSYRLSKKQWPILYRKLVNKIGHYFLDINILIFKDIAYVQEVVTHFI